MKSKLAIQCETKKEFRKLLMLYTLNGWKWSDDDEPLTHIKTWNEYKEKTCVEYCDEFGYADSDWFLDECKEEYKLIKFKDFKNG